MREIKFRAWDKELKRYSDTATDYPIADINYMTDYDWEQFTGLHDKNGKEIYDGDVVKLSDEYSICGNIPLEGIISFDKDGYWKCHNTMVKNMPLDAYEIIGNVHEGTTSCPTT